MEGGAEVIRFIDLRGHATGHRFAFWDTVIDRFCEFNNEQAWENVADFTHDFNVSGGTYNDKVRVCGIDRFVEKIPDWINEPMGEDD